MTQVKLLLQNSKIYEKWSEPSMPMSLQDFEEMFFNPYFSSYFDIK